MNDLEINKKLLMMGLEKLKIGEISSTQSIFIGRGDVPCIINIKPGLIEIIPGQFIQKSNSGSCKPIMLFVGMGKGDYEEKDNSLDFPWFLVEGPEEGIMFFRQTVKELLENGFCVV
jgi:hypothetical protein